jgi:CRISPR-associated protein Cmr6
MRDRVLRLVRERRLPDHAGLAHDIWAPIDEGKYYEAERDAWLSEVARTPPPEDYRIAFERWERSLDRPDTRRFIGRATSRLLVGHGNPSPTEVGLTLHRTWGVPVIPGSSLKGLLASYVETVYGPDDPDHPGPEEADREPFAGVGWNEQGNRLVRPPGTAYRRLFGAPDVDGAADGASRGEVIVHDALWVPDKEPPLARDVLTVHQRTYYSEEPGSKAWPNDYDSPIPVAFLTVRPSARFLVAISGPPALLGVAEDCLRGALAGRGVGGKTAAGYGRIELILHESAGTLSGEKEQARGGRSPSAGRSEIIDSFEAWLQQAKGTAVVREVLDQIERDWMPRIAPLSAPERTEAARVIRRNIQSNAKIKERLARLLQQIGAESSG